MKPQAKINKSLTSIKPFSKTISIYLQEIKKVNKEISKKKHVTAIQLLNNLIELYPNDTTAYRLRYKSKSEIGDYNGALEDTNRLIEMKDKDLNMLCYHAYLKIKLGKLTEAEEVLNTCIKQNKKHVDTYTMYGALKWMQGDIDGTIQMYNKAILLDPKNYMSLTLRGLAYATLGNEMKALVDFEKIPQKNKPLQCIALLSRGLIYLQNNDLFTALNYFNKALEANPESRSAFFYRAIVKMELKDPTAESDYSKANQFNISSYQSNEYVLYLHIKSILSKDITRARNMVNIGIGKMPDSSMMWESLSVIQFLSGEVDEPLKSINKSIVLDEKNQNAWLIQQCIMVIIGDKNGFEKSLGKYSKAFGLSEQSSNVEEYIERVAGMDRKDPILFFFIGCMHYRKQDSINAEKYFRKAHDHGLPFTEMRSKEFAETVINHARPFANNVLNKNDMLQKTKKTNDGYAPNRKYQNIHFEAFTHEWDKEKKQQRAYDNICRQFPEDIERDKYDSFIIQFRLWKKSMK